MILEVWMCFLSVLLLCVNGAKLPEPEVKIEVLYKPFLCHRKSKYGDILLVHYEGFLESNGTMFHSSRQHGDKNPVWFTLGIREVIKGWDKGLQNMCAGERRKLTIPPSLAYGKEGKGKIPPESTLIFDIEIMEIRNGPRSHESFQEMDLNDDWKLSKSEQTLLLQLQVKTEEAEMDILQSLLIQYASSKWEIHINSVKEYLRKEFEKHGYPANDTHHEAMVEDIFKKEDEDEDGFISAREFTYKHDEL